MSFTDREACLYADITPTTLYRFCQENPEFSERKELLKEQVSLQAKKNLSNDIQKGNNSLSQWWLERRNKEFNPKQELDLKGNFTIEVINYKHEATSNQGETEGVRPEASSAPSSDAETEGAKGGLE